MKHRMTALALVLCLTLTACGSREDDRGRLSFLETAAEMSEETVLLYVNGQEVPAWRYLYWLARSCDTVKAQYDGAQLELDWSAATEEGSLAESVKEQALADTVLYAVVEQWAAQHGCTLSRDEELLLETEEEAEMGLSAQQVRELAAVGAMYGKLYTLFCTEGSTLSPSKEALAAYAEERGYLTLDRILIPAGEDPEAARNRAAEVFSHLNAADDQAAIFVQLAAESEDTAGPRTLLPGDGTLDPELDAAAKTLEVGQCSGILESAEGFSILHRLETDGSKLAGEYFDDQLQGMAEAAEVRRSEDYERLNAEDFYQALLAQRDD